RSGLLPMGIIGAEMLLHPRITRSANLLLSVDPVHMDTQLEMYLSAARFPQPLARRRLRRFARGWPARAAATRRCPRRRPVAAVVPQSSAASCPSAGPAGASI